MYTKKDESKILSMNQIPRNLEFTLEILKEKNSLRKIVKVVKIVHIQLLYHSE